MAKQKPRAMIGKVPVWCAHDKIVPCVELKPNPANPNTHPASQIELLGKIIREQGWRALITISNRSGLIVKGHARLEAAFKAGIQKAPVEYQDYESEAVEHADMVADNRIAELAVMDEELLAGLLSGLNDLDFDMELTGFDEAALKDFLPDLSGGGGNGEPPPILNEVYNILIECADEGEQVNLLNRFEGEGLKCRSLIS